MVELSGDEIKAIIHDRIERNEASIRAISQRSGDIIKEERAKYFRTNERLVALLEVETIIEIHERHNEPGKEPESRRPKEKLIKNRFDAIREEISRETGEV